MGQSKEEEGEGQPRTNVTLFYGSAENREHSCKILGSPQMHNDCYKCMLVALFTYYLDCFSSLQHVYHPESCSMKATMFAYSRQIRRKVAKGYRFNVECVRRVERLNTNTEQKNSEYFRM